MTNALIGDKYIRHSTEVDIHSFYRNSLKDSENNVRIGNKAHIKHIVTLLCLQNFLLIGSNQKLLLRKRTYEQNQFLICDSCIWCGSFFNVYREAASKCPSCNSNCVKSMPILHDEVYTFSQYPKRGVTLGVSKWRSRLV